VHNTVWLGLGANLGDRADRIFSAVQELSGKIENIQCSNLYETEPQDYTDQPDFLNAVLRGDTSLNPWDLLDFIDEVEKSGGRMRTGLPKGPRTIDIDILLFGSLCFDGTDRNGRVLTIPHGAMDRRLFVLRPLLELDGALKDPRDGITWAEKASHLSGQRVKLYRR
jgi:2-amino-4-hydroxy-6-hydroxymethyldihydropteridine diphosphokinase